MGARRAPGLRWTQEITPWGNDAADVLKRLNACCNDCVRLGTVARRKARRTFDGDDCFATTAPVGSFPLGDSPLGTTISPGRLRVDLTSTRTTAECLPPSTAPRARAPSTNAPCCGGSSPRATFEGRRDGLPQLRRRLPLREDSLIAR